MKRIITLLFAATAVFATETAIANTEAAKDTNAVENKTIAILEIIIPESVEEIVEDEFSEEAVPELTVKETEFLSSELRRQAVAYFPKGKFNVLTKGQIIDRIPEDTTQDLTNALGIGKAIQSDYVTYGQVGRLGKLLTLKIELYDISGGTVLGEFNGEAPDMKGLVDAIRDRIPALFAYIYKEEKPKPVVAAPVQVTVDVKQDTTIVSALQSMQQQMLQSTEQQKKFKVSKGVAIGFDILALAAAGIGVYQHVQTSKYYDDYKSIKRPSKEELYGNLGNNLNPEIARAYNKVEDAKNLRDISIIAAGALLASGITIHIVF